MGGGGDPSDSPPPPPPLQLPWELNYSSVKITRWTLLPSYGPAKQHTAARNYFHTAHHPEGNGTKQTNEINKNKGEIKLGLFIVDISKFAELFSISNSIVHHFCSCPSIIEFAIGWALTICTVDFRRKKVSGHLCELVHNNTNFHSRLIVRACVHSLLL